MEGRSCSQGEGMYISFVTDPLSDKDTPIKPCASVLGSLFPGVEGTKNAKTGHFHSLFPNMFWFLLPNHLFTVIVEPISATQCVEHASLFVHGNVDEEKYEKEIEEMWKFYDIVNSEDIRA